LDGWYIAADPCSIVVMVVPVTVTGSAVVCLLSVEFGCPNASRATSRQASVTIIFFMMSPFLMDKCLEPVWIQQEPLRVFDSVQFHLACRWLALENTLANGRVIGRKRVQLACPIKNRVRRSGAGVRS
jgi:hypothetical protein